MNGLIEGIGDEVIWVALAVVVITAVCLAWISTGTPPFEYYVWLVQMHINPNRSVVQVLHMDHEDASVLENQLAQQRISQTEESETRRLEAEGVSQRADLPEPRGMSTQLDSGAEGDGQPRRLFLSRVPVQIQQSAEPDASLAPDLNAIALRNHAATEQREHDPSSHSRAEAVSSRNTDLVNNVPAATDNTSQIVEVTSEANSCLKDADKDVPLTVPDKNEGKDDENDAEPSSHIKIKFLDDTQIIAATSLGATVGQFKRRYFWESIVAGKVIRLIFRGQLLRDESRSLSSYGLHDQCVLHCHVSSTPYAPAPSPSSSAAVSSPQRHESNGIAGSSTIQTAAAAAIAAIAGSQSAQASTAAQFIRRIPQTYRGRSIEDNPNDSYLTRGHNALIRGLRTVYNAVMGPDFDSQNEDSASLNAAADAAARGWNDHQQPQAIGARLGQHLHLLFVVKFVMLWTFVFFYPQYTDRFSLLLLTFLSLFFATIMFSNRHTNVQIPTAS